MTALMDRINAAGLKHDGNLIRTTFEPGPLPSRWCRWIGHSWVTTTTRRGARTLSRDRECQVCGAEESWNRFDSLEAKRALAEAESDEEED